MALNQTSQVCETCEVCNLPAQRGIYALVMRLPKPISLCVGRLGTWALKAGFYVYVGSACGPGGLKARVGRHLRADKPLRWHIDYLRPFTHIRQVHYSVALEESECSWSQALAALSYATIPIPGFGASDCRSGCASHLVRVNARGASSITSVLYTSTQMPVEKLFQ
jgi:Uri superfamily endonuclease